jgi:hypothetical protein
VFSVREERIKGDVFADFLWILACLFIGDDMNFYGIISVSISIKMTKTDPNTKETYKSKKKHQDRVQDAKRQEKAQKVKKYSIPSQHDVCHRTTMKAPCTPNNQKK